MVIDVTRTGGLANLRRRVRVDTEELPPQQRDRLDALVESLDLDDLEQRSPIQGPGADHFQYDISISRDDRERRLAIDDSELPDDLLEIVDLLFEGEPS
jgi:hypothetical protein